MHAECVVIVVVDFDIDNNNSIIINDSEYEQKCLETKEFSIRSRRKNGFEFGDNDDNNTNNDDDVDDDNDSNDVVINCFNYFKQ